MFKTMSYNKMACSRAIILILFLAALFVTLGLAAPCCSHKTCQTCSNETSWWFKTSCRWCPFNEQCHTYGSIYNPCNTNQSITKSEKCYDVTPGKYSPDSAYTNTLFSAAAYSDKPKACLDEIYPNNDIDVLELIGKKCEDLPLFCYKACFAYTAVSHANKLIIMSFRGTFLTSQLVNQFISMMTVPRQSFPSGGEVQNYFKNAFDGLFPCASQSISNLVKKYYDYDVVVSGHSLGGAIASLTAVSLVHYGIVPKEKISLYTFGMPRVGDKEYAINHDRLVNNSWRVVHFRDVVAHLPTCDILFGCFIPKYTPFHHGIEIFYPEAGMEVKSNYKQCIKNEDSACSNGLLTKEPCITDFTDCVDYHLWYFGLEVGMACNSTLYFTPFARKGSGLKPKRLFRKSDCRRIDAKTMKIIKQVSST